MKVITYHIKNSSCKRIGILYKERYVLDLKEAFKNYFIEYEGLEKHDSKELAEALIPNDTVKAIRRWNYLKPQIAKVLKYFSQFNEDKLLSMSIIYKLTDIRFLPAIPNPSKIIGIGLNYEEYRVMLKYPKPEVPLFFFKPTNTLIGHEDKVKIPKGGKWPGTSSSCLFHEYEMAVIIGKEAKNISQKEAHKYVFGVTIFSDITAHDIEMIKPGFVLYQQRSKAFDTFSPTGPWILTMDEIVKNNINIHNLRIRRLRNNVVEGESNTKNMIYKTWEILEFLSEIMTLKPGDIISLGSPPAGPKKGLRAGDTIEVEIEHIGTLRNYVE